MRTMIMNQDSRECARLARRLNLVISSPGTTASSSATTATTAAVVVDSTNSSAVLDHSASRMTSLNSRRCVGLSATARTCGSALGMVALLGSSGLGGTVVRASAVVRPWGDATRGSSVAGWEEGVWEFEGAGGGLRGGRRRDREGVERLDTGSFWFEGGDGGELASRAAGPPTGMPLEASVSVDRDFFDREQLRELQTRRGGDDSAGGGDDGDGVGEEEEDSEDNAGEDDTVTSRKNMLVTISIVVGCGVVTLVILCVVRKIMDLCLLRNDPTGSLRYSVEEGLSKSNIERLPQTKYKKPAQGKGGKGGKSGVAGSGGGSGAGLSASIPEPGGAVVAPESTAGGASAAVSAVVVDERDSTADMCAICLVEYENGDELRVIPGCRHHFHKECIDPWLETKAVCAYCKAQVEAKKSCCDRVAGAVSNRLGLNLVAPTTIQFSSSRRTYTNQDVQLATGPNLPPAYGHSEMDYVGSMLALQPGGAASDAGGGQAEQEGGDAAGALRSGEEVEPLGAIVVQPASAPSFVFVPRDFSSSAAAPVEGSSSAVVAAPASATATAEGGDAREGEGVVARSAVARQGDGGSGVSEEKGETKTAQDVAIAAESGVGSAGVGVGGARGVPRVGRRGVIDGRGGVVFGGGPTEFKEPEAVVMG